MFASPVPQLERETGESRKSLIIGALRGFSEKCVLKWSVALLVPKADPGSDTPRINVLKILGKVLPKQ